MFMHYVIKLSNKLAASPVADVERMFNINLLCGTSLQRCFYLRVLMWETSQALRYVRFSDDFPRRFRFSFLEMPPLLHF